MAYSNATFFVDDGSVSGTPGNDSARTPLTSCTASNPSGTITRINKVGHGLVTGAVVDLTLFSSWLNEAWKITKVNDDNFDLDGAVWQTTGDASGTVTPRGGSSWADAWETVNSGALSSRIQAGDTVRLAKSGDPVSVGSAQWTNGPIGLNKTITSSTNATPIVVTASNHGFNNGDVIRVFDHQTNTNANGVWRVANKATNTFELVDAETGANSVGNGVGSGGKARNITAQVVELTTAQTATVDNCEEAWSVATGYVGTPIGVTDGGKGYSVDDILSIDDGPSDATVRVLTVATTGPVLTVTINDGGLGYTVGDTLFISAGDYTAEVTVTTTTGAPNDTVTGVTVSVGGDGYSVANGVATSGGTGGGTCVLDITSVDDGDVLTVALEDQSALGGYTIGAGVPTQYGGGTGCTLNITTIWSAGSLTLHDNATGPKQSPQADKHIEFLVSGLLIGSNSQYRLAYKTLPSTLDLSSYDQLTFWLYNSTTSADEWQLRLCSDTDGLVTEDIIKVPALPASDTWVPVVASRDGGGFFGASIQSIALYADSALLADGTLSLDNISASVDGGLNLQSLITKNSAAYGGSEYNYTVESISGPVVLLGAYYNPTSPQFVPSGSGNRRGYLGTTENVTTYIRKPILMYGLSGGAIAPNGNGGGYGSPVTYSGGWDPVGGTQNGTTIIDGLLGTEVGFNIGDSSYVEIERFQTTRYEQGVRISSSYGYGNVVQDVVATHCTTGVHMYGCTGSSVSSMKASYCDTALKLEGCTENVVTVDDVVACANGISVVAGAYSNIVESITARYSDFGVSFGVSKDNEIRSGTFNNCYAAGIYITAGANYGRDLTFSSCLENVYTYPGIKPTKFNSKNHNGSGQNFLVDQGIHVLSQNTTRPTGSGLMWGITALLSYRDQGWPYYLPIAQVPVEPDLLVTASLWMKKSDANDIAASFICKGGQIAGVTFDVETTKAADTAWENVTITFTPTERGVVELGAKVWFVNSLQTVYIDDISISQAV